MMAHDMWSKLGSSKFDYNFVFATPSTATMYELMPVEERSILKVCPSHSNQDRLSPRSTAQAPCMLF